MATKSDVKSGTMFSPVALGGLFAGPAIAFETEENSPFADGYSIVKEERALADYVARGTPDDDPLFDRYVELEDRRERLTQMETERQARRGADVLVSPQEAQGIDDLGALANDGVDQMTIHTLEAYRLFQGRSNEPGSIKTAIIGGKRIASALRNLWILTANDNPYAEWALLRHEHGIAEVQKHLQNQIKEAEIVLNLQRKRGLSFSVVASTRPVVLNLGFRSPYGYAISMLVVDYDYFVRLQKTLQRKNLLTDEQAKTSLRTVSRAILRIFNETNRFARWLGKPEVKELSRADWVSSAADAAKRVEFVVSVFGLVPAQIFRAAMAPSHSRRRLSLSDAEREVLKHVGKQLELADEQQNAGPGATDSPEDAAVPN